MLIIEKNGKTMQVSGWRAWILAFGVVLGVAATMVLLETTVAQRATIHPT